MADKADDTVILAKLQVTLFGHCDCVHVVGHFPNFQTLLPIIVSASIMASPPAFITINSLFVAAASITIVCSRIDDDDGKVGVRL